MDFRIPFKRALIFISTIFILTGCLNRPQVEPGDDKITINDALGRCVEIDPQVKRIVAVGPGALRLCCYFGEIDTVVGIEQIDKGDSTGKPYMLANPSLKQLPVVGQGGPNNFPDPEKIIAVAPDIIFSTYATDTHSADRLEAKTGIPVIAISYGETPVFDPQIYNSIEVIGKAINRDKRAKKIIDYMKDCEMELRTRTQNIASEERPSAYIGALSMRGAHGIDSTYGNYALFNAINAKNVADEIGRAGSIMIDKEKIIQWDPDVIFIDAGGMGIVRADYNKNPGYYNILSAFKNGKLYLQLPFNYYHTNIDTAIANAYYMGKVLFPGSFEDIEPDEKADEIYSFLLGKELYHQMEEDFGGFGKVTFD
ncbi:MAG: iron ABC transporter substrate-binding protein [Clostridium sp.]|nr:iron ABC transporter substrate-binding protein [Clostridium sp.]